MMQDRDTQIYLDRKKGATFREISSKYSISASRCRQIFDKLERVKEKRNMAAAFPGLGYTCACELWRIGARSASDVFAILKKGDFRGSSWLSFARNLYGLFVWAERYQRSEELDIDSVLFHATGLKDC